MEAGFPIRNHEELKNFVCNAIDCFVKKEKIQESGKEKGIAIEMEPEKSVTDENDICHNNPREEIEKDEEIEVEMVPEKNIISMN